MPRRKPLSTSNRHSAADRLDNLRQDLDCRATAVHDASTVVRNNDAINAIIGREFSVLLRENPLEHDLHLEGVALTVSRKRLIDAQFRFAAFRPGMPLTSMPSKFGLRET